MTSSWQNAAVMLAAAASALAVVQTQTGWLSGDAREIERERCYGVARQGANDCATARHSCAGQSAEPRDPNEWIMVPAGVCAKLTGGVTEAL